jgi:hypothetical protein
MAWNDLVSNECPTKEDINTAFRNYKYADNYIVFKYNEIRTYNIDIGNSWNFVFIYLTSILPSRYEQKYVIRPSCLLIPTFGEENLTYKMTAINTGVSHDSLNFDVLYAFNSSTGIISIKPNNVGSWLTDDLITCRYAYIAFT